jgi:hypothetical protein
MAKKSMIERLALPMFIFGIIAMVSSATISLGTSANATSPLELKRVTLTYLSTGYSANDSGCGSAQDIYTTNRTDASFRARSLGNSNSDKTFECTATFYMVTNVSIPTPKPVPTVTIIYKPQPSSSPTRTQYPTRYPTPTPTATRTPNPRPTIAPTPVTRPNWWQRPSPTPSKQPRP